MSERQVVICSPVRTAIGTYNGTLKETPAAELGASAIRGALTRLPATWVRLSWETSFRLATR